MKTWLRSFSELSHGQKKIVQIPPFESCLVSGPPGSGKTQALVHRASFLVKKHNVSPERIRLFVCNEILETLLKSEIKRLDLPEKTVISFDRWSLYLYSRHISKDLPRIYVNGRIDFEKIRSGVLGILQRKKDLQGCLAYALVDEGEDLTPEAVEILGLVAKNITLILDPLQKIHERAAPDSFAADMLNIHSINATLSRDFRSPFPIAQLASRFVEDRSRREKYLSHIRNEQKTFPFSFLCTAPSRELEVDYLSRYIQLRQSKEEKIGIVLPTSGLVHSLAKDLEERGVRLEKAMPIDAQNVIHRPYDFKSLCPKITTYALAKGLSFDSVLMPFLTEEVLSGIPDERRYRLIFVGMIRASRWVYLSTVRGEECREFRLLKSAH